MSEKNLCGTCAGTGGTEFEFGPGPCLTCFGEGFKPETSEKPRKKGEAKALAKKCMEKQFGIVKK